MLSGRDDREQRRRHGQWWWSGGRQRPGEPHDAGSLVDLGQCCGRMGRRGYTQGLFTLEAGTITGNTAGSGGGIFGTCAVVTVAVPSADHVFGNTPALDQIFQAC